MIPHRIILRLAAVAAFAAAVLVCWRATKPDRATECARAATDAVSPESDGGKPAVGGVRMPDAPPRTDERSREQWAEFFAAHVRAWEDDDAPEWREERLRVAEDALERTGRTMAERLAVLDGLPPSQLNFAYGLPSIQRWMLAEPAAALDWMSTRLGVSRARVLTVLQEWGRRDRPALQQYLAALPEGGWKQDALVAASYEALPARPIDTIIFARQLNASGQQTGLLGFATTEWARRDPGSASEWVARIGDAALRDRLNGAFALGIADAAPDLAAEWALTTLPVGAVRDRAIDEIAATPER